MTGPLVSLLKPPRDKRRSSGYRLNLAVLRAVPTASQPLNLKPPLHPRCIQSTSGYDEPPLVTTARARNLLTIQRAGRQLLADCRLRAAPRTSEPSPRRWRGIETTEHPAWAFMALCLSPSCYSQAMASSHGTYIAPFGCEPFPPSDSALYGVASDMRGIADLRIEALRNPSVRVRNVRIRA